MNWWDENKFFEKLNIFTWISFLIFCLFLLSFTSKAADPEYFPMEQNQSGDFDGFLDTINNYFDTDNYYYVMYKSAQYGDGVGFTYVKCLKSDGEFYGEISNDGYHWSLYRLNNSSSISVGLLAVTYNQTVYDTYVGGNYGSFFSNLVSSNYDNTVSYASNFRIYANNNENAGVILKYGPDPVGPVDVGIAIIPPEPILPDFDSLIPPTKVPPTYTPSDYSWTTPPTFDGTSVEAALGSIQNVLGWLANNLQEEFKNITDNLEGFFKYIGETIQYYAGIIIDTLNNFIKNFYDNMSALVQPIFEKLDYLTQPLEASVIWDNISGTSLISNFNTISSSVTALKGSFDNLSEPSTYTIPIHLENLPSSMFGTLTTQYIDLSVINPVKSLIRVFMWAIITYSLAITIFDSIANYINGGGDES